MEREADDKDTEIANANREIQQLGDQVWRLEEEGEALRKELGKIRDEEAVERDRLEALVAAYKDVSPS
jgi:septal ring factor EnvC (AmiA/AmiB activator)